MTQKQIYEAVCDLAYDENTSPEEYILGLMKKKNDEIIANSENLPDDVKATLIKAEEARREAREIKRRDRSEQSMKEDIKRFREYFPDVKPEDIPESVWNDAANGIPLSNAYALYIRIKDESDGKAREFNQYTDERSVPVGNDESEAPYTKEEVESMPPSAVKKNYKKILNSIKGWKF